MGKITSNEIITLNRLATKLDCSYYAINVFCSKIGAKVKYADGGMAYLEADEAQKVAEAYQSKKEKK